MSRPIFALFLLLAPLLAGASAATLDGDRTSLEKLLAEEAAKRALIEAELAPRVSALLDSLSGLSASKPGDPRVQKINAELVALGAPATPLMVVKLDPGSNAKEVDIYLAARVAEILTSIETAPITADLIEIARNGTDRGRRGAILVLGNSSEKDRVGIVLGQLFRDSNLGLELPALRSLARLGGSYGAQALQEALTGSEEVINEALSALTEYGAGESLPLVRELLSKATSERHAEGLLLYFQANHLTLDREDTKNMVTLAANRLIDNKVRRRVLLALPDLDLDWNSSYSKLLTPTKEDSDPKLSQAALICLSRLGHKGEEKDLLKPYKDAIDDDPKASAGYESRAEIYLSLHEYEEALKDYKKAIKLYEESRNSNLYAANQAHIGAARALIFQGEIKDAAKMLEDSSLSTLQLRALATDPDFEPLVSSNKYREVLRL